MPRLSVLMQTPSMLDAAVIYQRVEAWSLESGTRNLELPAAKHILCFMAEWMDLEISFWFLVAIGLGLVLLVSRKVRKYRKHSGRPTQKE